MHITVLSKTIRSAISYHRVNTSLNMNIYHYYGHWLNSSLLLVSELMWPVRCWNPSNLQRPWASELTAAFEETETLSYPICGQLWRPQRHSCKHDVYEIFYFVRHQSGRRQTWIMGGRCMHKAKITGMFTVKRGFRGVLWDFGCFLFHVSSQCLREHESRNSHR